MTSITISDLHSTDVGLFLNSESLLNDLSYKEFNEVYGGSPASFSLGYAIGYLVGLITH